MALQLSAVGRAIYTNDWLVNDVSAKGDIVVGWKGKGSLNVFVSGQIRQCGGKAQCSYYQNLFRCYLFICTIDQIRHFEKKHLPWHQ